jgi:hypothetical protein
MTAGTALGVGGSTLAVRGVFLNSGCIVTVGGASCVDVAVVKVDGIGTLTAVAPPGDEGTVDLTVEDPSSSTSDTWQNAITYTVDPFHPDLDTTPGIVRSWESGATATLHVYLPASGDVTMMTPEGTELTIPAALRTGYQAGFILVRDAARLSGLPLDQTPATPDGFIAVTPALDIGGLVDNGAIAIEIDEPFAEAVAVTFPVLPGTADEPLQLSYIESHLDTDLGPFCAVAPGERAQLTAGAAPTAVDAEANTATFELFDFTTYAGILPGLYPPSDVNQDGAVNAIDVQLVINEALGFDTGFQCDVDRDGTVNAIDVQLVINAALGL